MKLSHTAQCFTCFARWFPTWSDVQVADWLEAQWIKATRVIVREEAKQLEMELAA